MSFVCPCGAAYAQRAGLYKHQRKCKEVNAALDEVADDDGNDSNGEESDEELVVTGSGAGKF